MKKLQDALFPVSISDVFRKGPSQKSLFKNEQSKFRLIPRFKAIVAEDTGHVFSVVAPDYKLVTNKEAVELGKICFDEVFSISDSRDMQAFNVIMPKTRSFCHIDFMHNSTGFKPFDGDSWFPYLRVTNSYNRMYALNFDLGFCRGICKNGVIFGKRNIEFKYVHSKSSTDPKIKFSLKAGEIASLEKSFVESILNLKRFHVPKPVMWALACKVFKFNIPTTSTPKQLELFEKKQNKIDILTDKYFGELGENGYAALNVLTDFASRPVGFISQEGRIDLLQRKAGGWIEDFVKAIESRKFSFENFLGDYYKMVA